MRISRRPGPPRSRFASRICCLHSQACITGASRDTASTAPAFRRTACPCGSSDRQGPLSVRARYPPYPSEAPQSGAFLSSGTPASTHGADPRGGRAGRKPGSRPGRGADHRVAEAVVSRPGRIGASMSRPLPGTRASRRAASSPAGAPPPAGHVRAPWPTGARAACRLPVDPDRARPDVDAAGEAGLCDLGRRLGRGGRDDGQVGHPALAGAARIVRTRVHPGRSRSCRPCRRWGVASVDHRVDVGRDRRPAPVTRHSSRRHRTLAVPRAESGNPRVSVPSAGGYGYRAGLFGGVRRDVRRSWGSISLLPLARSAVPAGAVHRPGRYRDPVVSGSGRVVAASPA